MDWIVVFYDNLIESNNKILKIKKDLRGVTVHWDGKLMENILTKEKHERLPVKITHQGVDQLLGAPEIDDGSGLTTATAVYDLLVEWDQNEKIKVVATTPPVQIPGVGKGQRLTWNKCLAGTY